MSEAESDAPAAPQPDPGPTRALTIHLLRMIETRMDAAGVALSSEVNSFTSRLQLKLLAVGALFLALWGGIVLIAIALPEAWRIPVLAAVVVALVLGAVWAQAAARRKAAPGEIGSMSWFVSGLKRDLEVLSRSLHQSAPQSAPFDSQVPPSDHAA